jgi:hypothetical protein
MMKEQETLIDRRNFLATAGAVTLSANLLKAETVDSKNSPKFTNRAP